MSDGPWAVEDVIDLIDPHGPWHGGKERPKSIEENANPGSLVACLLEADGTELGRWLLSLGVSMEPGIDEATDALKGHPDRRVVLFDGDCGHAVVSLGAEPL